MIGKFKDKASGIPIKEFIGLKSKMYSYLKDDNCNSIERHVKQDLTHLNYKYTLFNKVQIQHTMKTIRSELHQIGSYELNKISLSCFDDKRYIHDDGITSYAIWPLSNTIL